MLRDNARMPGCRRPYGFQTLLSSVCVHYVWLSLIISHGMINSEGLNSRMHGNNVTKCFRSGLDSSLEVYKSVNINAMCPRSNLTSALQTFLYPSVKWWCSSVYPGLFSRRIERHKYMELIVSQEIYSSVTVRSILVELEVILIDNRPRPTPAYFLRSHSTFLRST